MKAKLLTIISFATAAMILSGCQSASYDIEKWDEKIDTQRTQLYVHNYDGGFGSQWLKDAKSEYEKLHANDVYEEGKKGVQIMIKADKNTFTPSQLQISTYDLFFLQESKAYSYYKNGAIEAITDAITKENPYEPGTTLEDKMNDFQKAFFKDGNEYFGISHYVGSWGLSYNKSLFDQNGFYFVNGYEELEGDLQFARKYKNFDPTNPDAVKRSAGRDNVFGTDDDGLPQSYEDFIALCNYISGFGYTPFTFSSKQKDNYVTSLVNALFVDSLGYEEASKLYDYGEDGVYFDNLIQIDTSANGNKGAIKMNGDNYMIDNHVLVSDAKKNGYEIYRNEKYLQTLQFMQTILTTAKDTDSSSPKYFPKEILTSGATYDYQSAQRDMVISDSKTCMIIEGQWWENEASSMAKKYGTSYDFGWMPLPRPTRDDHHANVYVDTMDCVSVVRKGTNKKAIALDFIQYVDSKNKLVDFTKTTNAVKGLEYNLNEKEVEDITAELTCFGGQVFRYRQNADLLLSDTKNQQFITNLYAQNAYRRYVSTYADQPITAFLKVWTSDGVSAEQYFAGTYTHYKQVWVA